MAAVSCRSFFFSFCCSWCCCCCSFFLLIVLLLHALALLYGATSWCSASLGGTHNELLSAGSCSCLLCKYICRMSRTSLGRKCSPNSPLGAPNMALSGLVILNNSIICTLLLEPRAAPTPPPVPLLDALLLERVPSFGRKSDRLEMPVDKLLPEGICWEELGSAAEVTWALNIAGSSTFAPPNISLLLFSPVTVATPFSS
mmetsp:Transcript_30540/g.51142  ORF Transcript_30540/g.51142 Transcript_30540/m.51142 type:complete len:200 (+) Transcript_30540:467-1066(+)